MSKIIIDPNEVRIVLALNKKTMSLNVAVEPKDGLPALLAAATLVQAAGALVQKAIGEQMALQAECDALKQRMPGYGGGPLS